MIISKVYGALGWLRWQILPLRCLVCECPGEDGMDLCRACHRALPWNDHACRRCALPLAAADRSEETDDHCGRCVDEHPRQAAASAAFLYAAPIDRLLIRFKFHQDLAAGRLLSQLMLQRVPPFLAGPLQPMPLHRRRLRQRGYNQALELTRPLARGLCCPLWQGLQRTRETAAQSNLDADARRCNLRDAFAVRGHPPAGLTVVDDVMTTGATTDAALRALQYAGAGPMQVWVCARVP